MEYPPALTCWKRFSNRRGAVLLLAVYFSSLVLLIISGISLQRTFIETQASHVSRDKQQAFFLAEGALDFAMKQLETSDLPDDCYKQGDPTTPKDLDKCAKLLELPSGASFTLTTTNTRVVDQDTQEITRQVAATGTALRASATVTATVSAQGPLKGVWAKGPLWVYGRGWDGSGDVHGNLRSALGAGDAIQLLERVHHHGALQIGPSKATTESFTISNYKKAWGFRMGEWPPTPNGPAPGIELQSVPGETPTTTALPSVAPMGTLPLESLPNSILPSSCTGNITTVENQQLTITDGSKSPSPVDLSPEGDGQIVLCLKYIDNAAKDAKVIFESPATVYLTSSHAGFALTSHGSGRSQIYAVQKEVGYSVPDLADLGELKFIVTKTVDGGGGKVTLNSKRFAGSIYAPESTVTFFTTGSNSEYQLENIVGREVNIFTYRQPLSINSGPDDNNAQTTTVTIQSWSSQ